MKNEIKFKLETDFLSISKIRCRNFNCAYNLVNYTEDGWATCNLKYVEIDEKGICESKQEKDFSNIYNRE